MGVGRYGPRFVLVGRPERSVLLDARDVFVAAAVLQLVDPTAAKVRSIRLPLPLAVEVDIAGNLGGQWEVASAEVEKRARLQVSLAFRKDPVALLPGGAAVVGPDQRLVDVRPFAVLH